MVSPWTKSEGIFIQNGSKYRNSIKYEHITINHNAHYFHVNLRMFLDPFSRISSFTCNTITWIRWLHDYAALKNTTQRTRRKSCCMPRYSTLTWYILLVVIFGLTLTRVICHGFCKLLGFLKYFVYSPLTSNLSFFQ